MPQGENTRAAPAPGPQHGGGPGPGGVVDSRMARLARLLGTDEGFFLLALHSFVESFICDVFPPGRFSTSFPTLVWDFKDFLKRKGRVDSQDLQAIVRLSREHATANKVRHGFLQVGQEETAACTYNFLGFCRACGIEHSFLAVLADSLKVWQDRVSPLERSEELAKLKFDLFVAQRENRKLLQQAAGARDAETRAEQLEADLRQRTTELARERARADSKAERVDALRTELNSLGMQKKELAEELARYGDLEAYLDHLNRFTIYTRTRRDYERSFLRLTAEQQEALAAVTPGHDFLVRGGAGTGKTIVLLHAYGRARRGQAEELGLEKPGRTVLLTYTTTLVKYDRYLAELLRAAAGHDLIQTADSFFLAGLRAVDPSWKVDYEAVHTLAKRWNTTGFLPSGELAAEIEDFLFANMVTRAEYVEDRVSRRGMRQPLSSAQRAEVWEIRCQLAAAMDERGVFSKNYSRLKLVEALESRGGAGAVGGAPADVDVAFVDESQDLTAADLRALKLMSRRGVVMAGDAGQAIYGLGSPYRRAGIDISGRTRILRTDFRTTCPIHDLSEKYRELSGPDIEGESVVTHAFREGPSPELYAARTREELAALLVEKAGLFIEKLGYDPENITVLAPGKADVAALREKLARRGIASADIRDDAFSFTAEGLARVSTLHSSKGLDFPVVLLYLPGLPLAADRDEKAAVSLARNLIYVAMTRAMDNLNIFVLEEAREPAIADLVRLAAASR